MAMKHAISDKTTDLTTSHLVSLSVPVSRSVPCIRAVVRSTSIYEEEPSAHRGSCCRLETRLHVVVLRSALHSHTQQLNT